MDDFRRIANKVLTLKTKICYSKISAKKFIASF